MAFYFRTKKLDISSGDPLVVVMNTMDLHEYGFTQGEKVHLCWRDLCLYVSVDVSDSVVAHGELGLFNEVWDKYDIPQGEHVAISIPEPAESYDVIRKKILGGKLNYDEIKMVMEDVANRRVSKIMMTYFAAASFNPGFDDEEVYFMTKAMAETGDIFDFTDGDPNLLVVDKHSIGGIPSKGVTPIIVPIIALFDLIVPNTASRAITTPAGTSDMLEVIMPVIQSKEQIMKIVKQEGACLVWGGGVDLAPADDIMINIERPLNVESADKYLISIIAKKVAMNITHLLIDLPYGDDAKVKTLEEAEDVKIRFDELCSKFNIKNDVFLRESVSPDGYGIGPLLEARDLLRIYERDSRRPVRLEEVALEMAGRLLELSDVAGPGEGYKLAKAKLESGEAEEKFWKIAEAQGAKSRTSSDKLILAKFSHEVKAEKAGVVQSIGNRAVVDIARGLGCPFIKEAGIYFDKLAGDHVNEGEVLYTLYATSPERLEIGVEVMEREGEFVIIR